MNIEIFKTNFACFSMGVKLGHSPIYYTRHSVVFKYILVNKTEINLFKYNFTYIFRFECHVQFFFDYITNTRP